MLQNLAHPAAVAVWPGMAEKRMDVLFCLILSSCRLERTTVCKGKTRVELQYAVTSLSLRPDDADWLLNRWRSHWSPESLHWVRDLTFGEDKCQVKRGHAPHNLAAFRNAAISLLRHCVCRTAALNCLNLPFLSG